MYAAEFESVLRRDGPQPSRRHGPPDRNLVFGRVFDLLAAYTWKLWRTQIDRWGPLGGGVALLAFLGMGGDRTDIFAPFAGFGSGCLFGLVFGVLESRSLLAAWHKHTLGLAAPLYFALAWTLVFLARA